MYYAWPCYATEPTAEWFAALHTLNLAQNYRVTDLSLSLISHCKALRCLNFTHTRITSSGIRQLKHLVELTSLAVHGCKVSKSAAEKLQEHCPNLVILGINTGSSKY
mmetsp:Transcript_24364/g.46250  ORF Transcript_24364/g.46250 Transcript_24364/m.46250 type:complete len:107 (+) Transcript_24364:961-1281(+)